MVGPSEKDFTLTSNEEGMEERAGVGVLPAIWLAVALSLETVAACVQLRALLTSNSGSVHRKLLLDYAPPCAIATVGGEQWHAPSPLWAACAEGRVGTASLLLQMGANVHARGSSCSYEPSHGRGSCAFQSGWTGWTALHIAAWSGPSPLHPRSQSKPLFTRHISGI